MSNSIDIRALVIRGADILNEGKFNFDRSKYLNGSEGGGCIRRQWYDKHEPELGAEQDWGYARRGSHGGKFLVDALIAANVPLAALTTDAEFLRRVTLDLTGKIPEPNEILAFLGDDSPDKRAQVVRQLLDAPGWADRWAMYFGDLFRNTRVTAQVNR